MAHKLEEILMRLKTDTTAVVELYSALPQTKYWALVRPETQNDLATADFLTYQTEDSKTELPIFTSNESEAFKNLKAQSQAEPLLAEGLLLFGRLKDIAGEQIVVAINPGTEFGIRLTKEMLLSAIALSTTQKEMQ